MVKISLEDRKFVVLFAALLSGALAFAILRTLLTSSGIIEAIDIQWNQNFAMFEYIFHTWNFYNNGSNIIFASQFPIYGWVLVFRDVALAQRFVYFLTVSLVSFNMFLVAFYTIKRTAQKTAPAYLGSIVASLIYTLNPLMFTEMFHISFLWAYSLFPLVFYFGWESFNTSSRRKVLVSALLLSMFFAFMADAWGMLVGLLILVIVAISSAVMNGRKNLVHRFVPNFLLTLLIMGVVTVLLASYWLLPYIMQGGASGPAWDPFSVRNLFVNSDGNGLINILGLHNWSAQPFFEPQPWWQALTLIVPIFAVSAVLLRRNKLTLTLSGLLVVGLFLATGVKYAGVFPFFGQFYLWLTFYSPKIISVQTFLLKYPYFFIAIVSLAVSILSAVLVTEVFGRAKFSGFSLKRFSAKSNGLPIVLFFSIISLIALVGAPLLTGNLNGALSPVTLPDQYKELNAFFSSQNGSFRVMYVPEEANFNWSANPWANKIENWGSGATPLMYGWGISASPNTGFLGDLVYDYLATNQTQYLGKLLALGNVKFIVFHNDSETGDQASAYPAFFDYFTQYKNYITSFLKSTEYKDYFLPDYLNFTEYQNYSENYKNSTEYQNFLNSSNPKSIENETLFDNYLNNYKNSSIYQNFQNSEAYLNNSLNSPAYQSYLNNFSKEYQNFIDSPNYNNSQNYLDSSEYLILTGSQYFANSTENMAFINSVEYRALINYYLLYTSNEYPDYAKAAEEKYGASYQNFQNSLDYTKYQTYLNYNQYDRPIYSTMLSNLQSQKDLKLVTIPNIDDNESLFVYENTEMMDYFQAYSKENLVVGGLDSLGSLSSISGLYLNESAFVFAENQQLTTSQLASILTSKDIAKNVVFYNNKTIDDLVLDTLDSGALVAPSDNFIDTSKDGWLKDAVTSFSWTPVTLGNYDGVNSSGKYDFGLGHNILYTINDTSLNFSVNVDKPGEHDVWARLLFSPAGGNLSLSIDGTIVGTVNTNTTKITDTKTTTSNVTNTVKMIDTNTTYLTNSSFPIDSNPNRIIDSYPNESTVSYPNATRDSYISTTPDSFTNTTIVTNTFTTNDTDTMTTNYANGNTTIVTNAATTIINKTDTTTVNNTISSILDGFKWVRLGDITLSPGKHTISIGNENGAFNAVDMVAYPAVSELESHKQNVLDLLNQSNAGIVYVMDNAFLGSLTVGGNLSVPFNAAKQSLYTVNLESNQQLSELNVTVDNRELKAVSSSAFAEGENWYSTGPIDLSQSSLNITLSNGSSRAIEKIIIYSSNSTNNSTESLQKILGGGAEPFVISYEKTDPVSFSVVVNITKPFILAYQESYDEFWKSNASASRIIVNSVNNGYLIDGNLSGANEKTFGINLTYTPEKYFQLGVKISVAAFILATLALILILLVPRFRQKKPLLNKPNEIVMT